MSIVGKPAWRLTTPPPTGLVFWLASVNGSHQKVVKKMSKSCDKLMESDNDTKRGTVVL